MAWSERHSPEDEADTMHKVGSPGAMIRRDRDVIQENISIRLVSPVKGRPPEAQNTFDSPPYWDVPRRAVASNNAILDVERNPHCSCIRVRHMVGITPYFFFNPLWGQGQRVLKVAEQKQRRLRVATYPHSDHSEQIVLQKRRTEVVDWVDRSFFFPAVGIGFYAFASGHTLPVRPQPRVSLANPDVSAPIQSLVGLIEGTVGIVK
jgi:hypothetical protein